MECQHLGRYPRLRRCSALRVWWFSVWLITSYGGYPALLWAEGLLTQLHPGKADNVRSCTVRIDRAPNAVSALGFEVVYDPMILRYNGHFITGELAKHLSFFNAHEATPGRIRIGGGAMTGRLESGSSGALLSMDFQVLQPGNPNIHLENLVDHVAGWSSLTEQPAGLPATTNSSRP